jgi:hypothetical protein
VGRFNQLDLDAFLAKAAWARNQAQAATEQKVRDEYLTLALAYEQLVRDIERQGPIDQVPPRIG